MVVISASATYAFASNGTGLPATGGDGLSGISGYEMSNVTYSFNASDAGKIDFVSFKLNAAAASVRIKLVSSETNWYNCVALGNNNWTCNTNGATTASANQLRLVAMGN